MKTAPDTAVLSDGGRDRHGRTISYVRISLTDVCNLRCVYCMPEKMTFRKKQELLTDEEVLRLIRLFGGIGFRKVRFTGGEPTLRSSLVEIIRATRETAGIESVGLTTNGILLDNLARPLGEAGLDSVNISIDTLDRDRFREITRWGNLDDVFAGIRAATKEGLRIKLNCVVSRGWNDEQDVLALAALTIDNPWQVRFIELMPFGNNAGFQVGRTVTESELVEKITARFGPLEIQNEGRLDGEARVYRIPGAAGSLGFISPVSRPFCSACNRVRITADGILRLCLLRDEEADFRRRIREGEDDDSLRDALTRAIYRKPWGHDLKSDAFPNKRGMSEIGG